MVRALAVSCALALLVGSAGPGARAAGTVRIVMTAADSASDPPVGSLRQILEDVAQPGDTIQFAENFSIQVDPAFRLEVPVALTGITLQGPAELRRGVLVVRGDGTTIAGMRFTDCRVFAGTHANLDDDSRTDGFTFSGNTLVNDAGLQLFLTADAVVSDNVFDVREPRGDNAVGDYGSDRPRWTHNTWSDLSKGGFSESDSVDLLFDGGNKVVGNAIFAPRSGRIEGNEVTGHLRVFHPDADVLGPLVIEGNTCATLGAHRPDLEVLENTVKGNPPDAAKVAKFASVVQKPGEPSVVETVKEIRAYPMSVGMDGVAGEPGYVVVKGNTVTATAHWNGAMLVRATAAATGCTVEGNVVEGGKVLGLTVFAEESAVVTKNMLKSGGKQGALSLNGTATGGFLVDENVLDGGTGPGIVIFAGPGTANLVKNSVKGMKGVGLQATGRPVVSEDGVYENCGGGVKIGRSTVASVRGGSVTGNKGAGIYADALSSVEVARVAFGSNGGAGIDLAPAKVSVNAKRKSANGNMGYPESLEYDASLGKAKGVAEPLARIDAYAVEAGPRAGNPKNGEGVLWLGEVVAGADGRFTFPAAGKLACPPSKRVTFTATRPGPDPVTSEFSADVHCGGAAFLLVDRNLAGGPGNDHGSGSGSIFEPRYRTISDDGSRVVFHSEASDLVEGDTNGVADLFVRDTVAGTTTRVSLTPAGGQILYEYGSAGETGGSPSISSDGRWVCYTSYAEEAFGEGTFYNNYAGVILYDTLTGTGTTVLQPEGNPDPEAPDAYGFGGGYFASVSGDGSAVIFTTRIPDEAQGDAGDDNDAVVWTRATGLFERVSVPTGGGDVSNGWQDSTLLHPRLSHDARFAVFASPQDLSGTGLPYGMRAWIRDRQQGTTEAVSVDSAGAIRSGGDPWPSDDGRYVAFTSGDVLVPSDDNGSEDVYLRDRQAGTTILVSRDPDGTSMYGHSFDPTLSGDGRYLCYRNFGNIWFVDLQEGTWTNVSGSPTAFPNVGCQSPRLSRTGQFVQYETAATNLVDLGGQSFISHVYLRDLFAEEE